MKWFLAFVVALNLLVGAFGMLRQRVPVDMHSQEVNPAQLKLLPADWVPPADASASSAEHMVESSAPLAASAPVAKVAASVPVATTSKPAAPAAKPAAGSAHPPVTKAVSSAPAAKPVKPAKAEEKPVPAKIAQHEADKALSCAQWPSLSDSLLTRVQAGLAPLKLAPGQMSSASTSEASHADRANVRYWVYYPGQGNDAASQALSTELKAKGFDNYIVQNEGGFKGSLSLGLFGKQDVAQALLARLKSAGYAKARIDERGAKVQTTTLKFKSLNPTQTKALQALQKRLTPGIALRQQACGK